MTPPLVYLGLDVAKATLAGSLAGVRLTLANNPAGHAALAARIAAHGGPVQVLCEATGGYERAVVAALRAAAVAVSVLHPTRARQLARGLGYLAKNDPLDAGRAGRDRPAARTRADASAAGGRRDPRRLLAHRTSLPIPFRLLAGRPA